MRSLRLACSCGSALHGFDEDPDLYAALEAVWRGTHSGPGHDDCDYLTAGANRVRKEKERLRAQIANSKGSN